MDFGKLLGDSFEYTKDGFFKKPAIWVMLIILSILPVIPFIIAIGAFVPSILIGVMPDLGTMIGVFAVALIGAIILGAFYMGYQVKIYRGETPLPEVSGLGRLFTDGIKYLVIEIIYSIPVFIILGVTLGTAIMSIVSAGSDFEAWLPIIGGVLFGILIAVIVGFIIGLFAVIGVVRFSRTGNVREAFNFRAIREIIRGLGWGAYILALIIVIVIIAVVQIVLGVIPYIGWILQLIISPFITVFFARYIALIYDSAEEKTPPSSTEAN
jgi:hypothetical protein